MGKSKRKKYYLILLSDTERIFPLDHRGCSDLIKFLDYRAIKFGERLTNIRKLIVDFRNSGYTNHIVYEKLCNDEGERIFRLERFDNILVDVLERNAYIYENSKCKNSMSIYLKNDKYERIRISNHKQDKEIKGIRYKIHFGKFDGYDRGIYKGSRLFSSEELKELDINIPEGIYLLK